MLLSSSSDSKEPSFALTGSEFEAVVEALSTNEQKLIQFERNLDMSKDREVSNELPPMDWARAVLEQYQQQAESSKEKLLAALQSVGLSHLADVISLSSKQK